MNGQIKSRREERYQLNKLNKAERERGLIVFGLDDPHLSRSVNLCELGRGLLAGWP